MGHRSASCFSKKTGKSLMAYGSEAEALQQAHHTRVKYQNDLAPYRCRTCNLWHLAPKNSRIQLETCSFCQGRDGNFKLSYPDEEFAERRAEKLSMATYARLRPYECPYGEGWHLTSH